MTTSELLKVRRGGLVITAVFMAALSGCASSGSILKPGDTAGICFQCRLQNGEIVAATDYLSVKKDQTLSAVYIVRDKRDPVSVSIPKPPETQTSEKERSFEDDIIARISGHLAGLKEGETRRLELAAGDLPERDKENYVIRLARIRHRPKEIRMTVGEYQGRAGKAPEPGQAVVIDPILPSSVETVKGQEVVIRFAVKAGDLVQTPWGPGRISEDGDSYKIDIDARKGRLVRTGRLVGRITDVDGKYMTIDYRNPFGGETLVCDVAIEGVTQTGDDKHDGAEEK